MKVRGLDGIMRKPQEAGPFPAVVFVHGLGINRNGDTTLPRSSGEMTTVGKEFWPSLASFDPIEELKQLFQPVLLIHGDQDTKVSVAEAQQVFAEIHSKSKKLKIFKGGDHGITDVPRAMREELLQLMADWFQKTLGV